jgi:predicted transcriptional regulator of viral defense system
VSKLARASKVGLVSVAQAAAALDTSSRSAALKLASLTRRGWLQRARRGLYLVLPLEAEPGRPAVAEDPWVLAQEAFSPCYIGGWSAAEYWGLTEQIFRSILVVTAANVRSKTVNLLGSEFRLFQVPEGRVAGATKVWRGPEQVLVSSRERTLADCLRNPELCGGTRTLFQMLREYVTGPEFNRENLLDDMRRFGNGAAWKRFGYLMEVARPEDRELFVTANSNLSAGNVKLDPSIAGRGRLLRRWRLWVNVHLTSKADET